ncbi:MAG: phosphoribosylamine--glycine ligase [Acidobacteria bacterium]|nr:phosphoribosylamine--glycine ligase [Acidobacteriota bacterium]
MKVLVVGGGGREHSLVWKIAQSPLVDRVYCAPGNAGIASLAECLAIDAADVSGLAEFAARESIDLTVVGPELPLSLGLADELQRLGLRVFGPRRNAAALEASKVFAKEFMTRHGIPTADYRVFRSLPAAVAHLEADSTRYPIVVKADGLAAGKGVVVAARAAEALAAVRLMMDQRAFGDAGDAVIVEECLTGPEVSFFALCDGTRVVEWPTCQDFKRALDGDLGPNTGGMGGYSPSAYVDAALVKDVFSRIIEPTVSGMAREGRAYQGILYTGLMLTERGPMVLEYNARLGDPEAELLLPRMRSDIVPWLAAAAEGSLPLDRKIEWRPEPAVTVVVASGGYPGSYERGRRIDGLPEAGAVPGATVFHCGTKVGKMGEVETAGGRVLSVTAVGAGLDAAARTAYQAVARIRFEGMMFRRDIASAAVRRIAGAEGAGV